MDSANVSSPAFTKLTTITVVADDDWIMEVTKAPVRIPETLVEVIPFNILRNCSPAIFCNPSLMIFMPKMKTPNAPNRPSTFQKL
jgi:hypothetical protein